MSFVQYVLEFIKTAPEMAFMIFVICVLISTLVQSVLMLIFD